MTRTTHRITMDVSPAFKKTIEDLAAKTESGRQSEVLRRAVALYELAVEAKDKKQHIAIINEAGEIVTRIVGV